MSEITRAAIGMPFEMAMENELSRRQFHSIAQALLIERDQLKADNVAALREATDLAMAIWRRCYAKDSPNFQPFEKASSVIGQIDNMAAGLMSDLEKLRAENAGLRTGYEAYEQVNAELKAECARSTERELLQLAEIEALRKDAERFSYIERDADSGMSKIYGDDWVAVIDAALGQGDRGGQSTSKTSQSADPEGSKGGGQ
ncbi:MULTISPECIES: hypothetical protein [unclassified Pseudomonas]|uniref:hypothetical protein n=1 Tax=unclassified Pseudomonas TaxID=196821 RepID=UPI0014759B9A|nr:MULTISPECIES: hypothetical protein [unclassified Pseudomonas]NMX92012.1 hypothetical protein [Pseudomonas sp. WS 5086]NMY46906.1 hypothetical protein [Pseudomonas sp. WS 5027]